MLDFDVQIRLSLELVKNTKLKEAALYSLFPGGKRFRPNLLLTMLGELGNNKLGIGAAVGIELLHTASLIHDDLPALDNDNERRGRPTVHCAFDEATAILVGDLLPSLAVSNVLSDKFLSNEQKIFVANEMSFSYVLVMEGQKDDLDQKIPISLIHEKKTSSLFKAIFKIALNLAGFNNLLELGNSTGKSLGLCFQYLDDLIDRFGDSEERGRAGSSDIRNAKMSADYANLLEEFKIAVEKLKVDLANLEKETKCYFPKTKQLISETLSRSKLVKILL